MSLKVACIFHGKNHLLFRKIVLAEDVQPVFLEIPIESRAYLLDLACNDSAKREGQIPVVVLKVSYVFAILKTISIS